jgi:uncharacterized protein YprB with RNaseH-like and TPR domain
MVQHFLIWKILRPVAQPPPLNQPTNRPPTLPLCINALTVINKDITSVHVHSYQEKVRYWTKGRIFLNTTYMTIVDLDNAIYVVFDLETTGLSQERHSIIEIACLMLDCNGHTIPESAISSLVKLPKNNPSPHH